MSENYSELNATDSVSLSTGSSYIMSDNYSGNATDIVNFCRGTSYYGLSQVLLLYVNPVIYCIGIPGNLLSLAIWLQRELRSSTACYFSALAISDTVVLLLHLVFTIQGIIGHALMQNTAFCRTFNVLFLSSECLSGLLVLGLTVDRFIVIKFPFKRYKFSTVRRTLRVLLLLVMISIGIGLIEGIWWKFDSTSSSCVVRPFTGRGQEPNLLKFWNIFILCLAVILPILVILALNLVIIHILRRKLARRNQMMLGSPHARHQNVDGGSNFKAIRAQKGDTEQTIMLLCISFYLIASECPDSVAYLLRPFFLPPDAADDTNEAVRKRHCSYQTAAHTLETFALTNYAFNILIYSLAGRRFRACMMRHICCSDTPPQTMSSGLRLESQSESRM